MTMSINTNTWSEATEGLTNNERGVLWALLHKQAPYGWGNATEWMYPGVQRTKSAHDDVNGYRHGTNVSDAGQIGKALNGLEDKGYIITAPRTGVVAEATRRYFMHSPVRFRYRDEEYRRWQADSKGYYSLNWYEVMHVTVPLAAELREAIKSERDGIANAQANAEVEAARERVDGERDRLIGFVNMLNEYIAKYGDGSLPVEPACEYLRELRGPDAMQVSSMLREIADEAESLRKWIDYSRDDNIALVAAHDAEREAVAA